MEEKFPKSVMIAGGISYYGPSDLMIMEDIMIKFAYIIINYNTSFL